MSVEAWEYYKDISTKTAETYKNKKEFIDIAVSIGLNFGEVGNTKIYCIADEKTPKGPFINDVTLWEGGGGGGHTFSDKMWQEGGRG